MPDSDYLLYRDIAGSAAQMVMLVKCPACGADLTGEDGEPVTGQTRNAHIASHDPEDFGLSPLEDVCDQSPVRGGVHGD